MCAAPNDHRIPADGLHVFRRRLLRIRFEQAIAHRFGFVDFGEYLRDRHAKGWGYNRIAVEVGQNRDWVRASVRLHSDGSTDPDDPP